METYRGDEIKEEKKTEHLFVCFVEELFNEDQQDGFDVDWTNGRGTTGADLRKGRDLTCYNKLGRFGIIFIEDTF